MEPVLGLRLRCDRYTCVAIIPACREFPRHRELPFRCPHK